jgi:hypothetical protein
VVFTTPNKRFPVELHTFLPLLHWLPDPAYRKALRRLGQSHFAEVENLNLLDGPTFLSLFPPERDNRLLATGLRCCRRTSSACRGCGAPRGRVVARAFRPASPS